MCLRKTFTSELLRWRASPCLFDSRGHAQEICSFKWGSGPPSSPCSASSRSCDGDLKARSSAGGSASPQRRFGVTGSDRPLTNPPLGLLEPEARSRTACVRGGTPLLLGLALLGSRTGFGIRYRDLDASLAPREAAGAREESRGRWRNGWV